MTENLDVPHNVGALFTGLMKFYDEKLQELCETAEDEESYFEMIDDLDIFVIRKFNMFCRKSNVALRLHGEKTEESSGHAITFMIVRVH